MIELAAGLQSQIWKLRKRLKKMDATKADPSEMAAVVDALDKLEARLAKEKEARKKKSDEKAAADAPKEEVKVEATPEVPAACPACGGEGVPMGSLGTREHNRCRQCGIDFSHDTNEATPQAVAPVAPATAPSTPPVEQPEPTLMSPKADMKKYALDEEVEPTRGTPGSKGRVMRHDTPNDLVYVMWTEGPLKDKHNFGGYEAKDLKSCMAAEAPKEMPAEPEKTVESDMGKEATSNRQVIEMFVNDSFPKDKMPNWGSANLKINKEPNGWSLINYYTPIMFRSNDGQVYMNNNKYSVTTSKLQGLMGYLASQAGISVEKVDEAGMLAIMGKTNHDSYPSKPRAPEAEKTADADNEFGFDPKDKNVPCEQCKRTDLPLHTDMKCPNCSRHQTESKEATEPVTSPEESAKAMIGDGKEPNKYWVTVSSDYFVYNPAVEGFDWAGDVYPDHQVGKGETYGPFDTFGEAMQKFEEEVNGLVEPTEEGNHGAIIEDRISGVIYEGIYHETTEKKGRYSIPRFDFQYHDDTRFTKETLGDRFAFALSKIDKTGAIKITSKVVKKDDGWHVMSEEGKNLGGPYDSKEKADKRLRQVEYFKHQGSLSKKALSPEEEKRIREEREKRFQEKEKQMGIKDHKKEADKVCYDCQTNPKMDCKQCGGTGWIKTATPSQDPNGTSEYSQMWAEPDNRSLNAEPVPAPDAMALNVANRKWTVKRPSGQPGVPNGYVIFDDQGRQVLFVKTDAEMNPTQLEQILFDELGKHEMVNATLVEDIAVLKKGAKVRITDVDLVRREVRFASIQNPNTKGWAPLKKFTLEIDLTKKADASGDLQQHIQQVRERINTVREKMQTQAASEWAVEYYPNTSDKMKVHKGFTSKDEADKWVKSENIHDRGTDVSVFKVTTEKKAGEGQAVETPAVEDTFKHIELGIDTIENTFRDKPEVVQQLEELENKLAEIEKTLGIAPLSANPMEHKEPEHKDVLEAPKPEQAPIEKENQYQTPKPTSQPPSGFTWAYDPKDGKWELVALEGSSIVY